MTGDESFRGTSHVSFGNMNDDLCNSSSLLVNAELPVGWLLQRESRRVRVGYKMYICCSVI